MASKTQYIGVEAARLANRAHLPIFGGELQANEARDCCGLDIGTTKTCAVVAAEGPDGLEIIGFGEAPSLGMRKGVVTDLEETIKSIEAATEKAERMAGVHIGDVFVGITGEHIRSTNNRAVVAVRATTARSSPADVRRVVDASKIINLPGGSANHSRAAALFYGRRARRRRRSGRHGRRPPGSRHAHRHRRDRRFITNVLKCVHRAGLESAGLVFEPLASSAATLLSEEKQVGVVLLDIGGGTTDIAVYCGGSAIYTATIPVGGNILTNDISLGLKTTLAEAENVKRAYGSGRAADDANSVSRENARRPLHARTRRPRSCARSSCRA